MAAGWQEAETMGHTGLRELSLRQGKPGIQLLEVPSMHLETLYKEGAQEELAPASCFSGLCICQALPCQVGSLGGK